MRISDWSSDVCSSDRPDKRRQYLAHPGIVLIRQQATKGTNIAYRIRHRRKQREGIDHFILPSLDQGHARHNTAAATQVRRWRHLNDIDDASPWIAYLTFHLPPTPGGNGAAPPIFQTLNTWQHPATDASTTATAPTTHN